MPDPVSSSRKPRPRRKRAPANAWLRRPRETWPAWYRRQLTAAASGNGHGMGSKAAIAARVRSFKRSLDRARAEGWIDWIRHERDAWALAAGCWFDVAAGEHAVAFIERFCRHSKGRVAGRPFILADWQRDEVVMPLFGWKCRVDLDGQLIDRDVPDGFTTRRYRKFYGEVGKKNGKALAADTPIPTPDGWKTMAELQPGDIVFGADGRQCRVIAVTEIMNDRPCYRLTFSDGCGIVADADHIWKTEPRRTGRPGGKALKGIPRSEFSHLPETQLLSTRTIAETVRSGNGANHRVINAGALHCVSRQLPIPPYVMGVWLGDGHTASARITCPYSDSGIIEQIRSLGVSADERHSSNTSTGLYTLGARGRWPAEGEASLQSELRRLGVLGRKHIPQAYLRAGHDQRMELLRGLMDTDGSCSKAGQCEFTTTSSALAEGVVELCRTLGWKATRRDGRAMLNGRDCGPKSRIQFWPFRDTPVFHLERKASRQKPRPARRARSESRYIIEAEAVPSVPVKCIQVDAPDGMYLAGAGMTPTHNSTMMAAIEMYCFMADNEAGAEVYTAANDRQQASIIYDEAANMAEASPEISQRVMLVRSRKRMAHPESGSILQALSAEVSTKEGLNASAVVIDELHAMRNRKLFDTLLYSGAAREQPLFMCITTAGFDRHSVCYEEHERAKQILAGFIKDIHTLAVLYAAEETDDWTDPVTWAKANPSLGVTIKLAELERECKRAQETPSHENAFKRYRLNIWTEQDVRWLPMHAWDACSEPPFDDADLAGRPCYGGIDLSSTRDLTSLVLAFPPTEDEIARGDNRVKLLVRVWCPRDTAEERERKAETPSYMTWARAGLMTLTEGNVLDYDYVRREVNELQTRVDIRRIAIDRWNAVQITVDLGGDGITMVPFGQGWGSMSGPTKELERLVVSGDLAHGGHPVLRWMAANVVVETDAAGNLKPNKAKSAQKIDAIVASIMAIGTMIAPYDDDSGPSIYETRGVLTLGG